jgi:hypothetical protein
VCETVFTTEARRTQRKTQREEGEKRRKRELEKERRKGMPYLASVNPISFSLSLLLSIFFVSSFVSSVPLW